LERDRGEKEEQQPPSLRLNITLFQAAMYSASAAAAAIHFLACPYQ
jgi:hypothetical protein